jgi:hypothetical protein
MSIIRNALKSTPVVSQAIFFYDIAKNVTNATDVEGVIIGGLNILKYY